MRKFLSFCLIALTLCVPSYAADETALAKKTVTSLQYVKAKLAERQDKVQAQSGTKAMTYGNNGSYDPGEISARDVKTSLGSSTTDTALPTVGAVNTGLNAKQNKVPAKDTNTVITYTGTSGVIGEKGIYQNSGSYSAQSDNLVDAGTFNAALKTGLDNEFVCADYDSNGLCWLWTIHNEKNSLYQGTQAETRRVRI